jgi:hypothetical protein
MDWIKKHYDRFALIVLGGGLLVSSGLLVWQSQQFKEQFSVLQQNVPHGNKIKRQDEYNSLLAKADQDLKQPAQWEPTHPGSLLVSERYVINPKDGRPVNPLKTGDELHPPVPNKWFSDNGLDILDTNILNEDPDGDGFTNLDEFQGKTDPQKKDSHPAYITKLRLKQWIKQPFRLKLEAYDGESFQINALDLHQPSQFVKMGEQIPGTKFKLLKYEPKTQANQAGGETDVSELTVQNVETGENVVLIMRQVVDSPDSYALFRFVWNNTEFKVKKDQTFALKPDPSVQYKLIDIRETEAVITNLKTNEQITVPRLEEAAR